MDIDDEVEDTTSSVERPELEEKATNEAANDDSAKVEDARKTYNFGKRKIHETRGETAGKQLFALALKHAVPQEFFDSAVKIFNNYSMGSLEPLPSYYLCKKVSMCNEG